MRFAIPKSPGVLEKDMASPWHAMQETWVQSLGWKDPLGGGLAPRSSTLAWRVPWTGEPDGLQSMGLQS